MCDICGNPQCGEYSTLSAGAKPVTDAVKALKAIGYGAVGVTASDRVVTGVPTMAHEPLTVRQILDKRESDKARLAKAHAAQHGTAKANENLNLPDEDAEGEAPKAKAQAKAEDKAQAAPAKD